MRKLDGGSQDIDIRVEDSVISGSPLSLLVAGSGRAGGSITFVRTALNGLQLVRPGSRVKITGN